MLIPCSRAQAIFADPGIRLDRRTPGFMVWDEHGGTFVLRVDELAATEVAAGEPESGIILEIPLSLPEELIRSLEEFAAQQQLPLAPPSGPELLEDVVLAACHLPVQNLFVFAEEPRLVVKRRGEAVELALDRRTSRPGGSPARKPTWSFTSPGPPWPGWWPWCSAWPGAGFRGAGASARSVHSFPSCTWERKSSPEYSAAGLSLRLR